MAVLLLDYRTSQDKLQKSFAGGRKPDLYAGKVLPAGLYIIGAGRHFPGLRGFAFFKNLPERGPRLDGRPGRKGLLTFFFQKFGNKREYDKGRKRHEDEEKNEVPQVLSLLILAGLNHRSPSSSPEGGFPFTGTGKINPDSADRKFQHKNRIKAKHTAPTAADKLLRASTLNSPAHHQGRRRAG